jgi:ABC-2 type transport system permease protein
VSAVVGLSAAALRRISRDRVSLFFMIVLPVVVILVVGASAGGFDTFDVAVVDQGSGALGARLTRDLDRDRALVVHEYDALDRARDALRRVELDAVVVLPAGMDERLRAGEPVDVPVLGERASETNRAARTAVDAVIAREAGRLQAARFVTTEVGGSYDDALTGVALVEGSVPKVTVVSRSVDAESDFLPEGFDYSAPTMLVLFVFINAMAGGAALIQNRDLGIHARMLAGPVHAGAIIAGEAVSFALVALLQSALIVAVGGLLFGVSWGPVGAAGALVVVWSLVGAGAGMLCGTLFTTTEQATSIGPPVGIAFGMLGGCMWPLEIVGPVMRAVGHVVPHAWAVESWIDLLSRGGGFVTIAPKLALLGAYAVVFMAVAARRLGRVLAR